MKLSHIQNMAQKLLDKLVFDPNKKFIKNIEVTDVLFDDDKFVYVIQIKFTDKAHREAFYDKRLFYELMGFGEIHELKEFINNIDLNTLYYNKLFSPYLFEQISKTLNYINSDFRISYELS